MKKILLPLAVIAIAFAACKKTSSSANFSTTEQNVINDFVNKTALPQYDSLVSSATALNTAVLNLQASTTDANLQIAQTKWVNVRTVWERCEGFLIGPVEANDYDPNTDTWPTDYNQLDALVADVVNHPLTSGDVDTLQVYIKGYHPLEYILFRNGESTARTAASFTPRELQYAASLSDYILNSNVKLLAQDWHNGYAQSVLASGTTGGVYTTKKAFFLDIVGDNGMAGICNEVGQANADGKMYNPFGVNVGAADSLFTESPYSNNSLADFKNNIIGAQNVYLGLNGGLGIKDLVAINNKSLDNRIQAQFTSAINSFDNITVRYEEAIYTQRTQVAATIAQVQALQALLDGELTVYIQTNVKD